VCTSELTITQILSCRAEESPYLLPKKPKSTYSQSCTSQTIFIVQV